MLERLQDLEGEYDAVEAHASGNVDRDDSADLEAPNLAGQHAVLVDRFGACGLDDGDELTRPSGQGWSNLQRCGDCGHERSAVDLPDGRGALERGGPPRQHAGVAVGHDVQADALLVGPRQRAAQTACWPVLQQNPTVLTGEQGCASGVGRGRAVSRPSVVTHESLELERRQRGAAIRDGYFLLGYFLALAGLRSP